MTKMRASSSRTYMRGSSNSSISRGAGGRSSHSALGSPGAAAGCWDAASVIPVDGPSRQNEGDGDGCCTEMSPPLSDRPHGEGHGGGSMETSPPPSASPALSDGGGYRCYEVSPGSITTVHPLRARNGTKGRQKETPSTGGGGGGSGGGGSQDIGIGGCGGHGGGGSRAKDADLTVRGTSAAAPPSGFEQYYQQQSKGDAGDNGDDARSDTVARRSVISHGESGGGAAIGDNSGASTVIWGIIRDMELQRQLRAEMVVGRQAAAVASAEAAAVHAAAMTTSFMQVPVPAEQAAGQQGHAAAAAVVAESASGRTAADPQGSTAGATMKASADGGAGPGHEEDDAWLSRRDVLDDEPLDEYTEHWEEEEEEEGDGADSITGVGSGAIIGGVTMAPSACVWSPNPTFSGGGCKEATNENMAAGVGETAEGGSSAAAAPGLGRTSVGSGGAAPAPPAVHALSPHHDVPAAFAKGLINPMYERTLNRDADGNGHAAGNVEGAATDITVGLLSPNMQQEMSCCSDGGLGEVATAVRTAPASLLQTEIFNTSASAPTCGSGLKQRRSIDSSRPAAAVDSMVGGFPLIDALQRILLDQ